MYILENKINHTEFVFKLNDGEALQYELSYKS